MSSAPTAPTAPNRAAVGEPHLLGWLGILRLGLVQVAIGSLVVLATSTFNRIMVVELAFPAVFPGLLVAIHYAVQMSRTRVGHGSDNGGRLSSWILGGMLLLAIGVIGAAAGIGLMATHRVAGVLAEFVAYVVIGLGVGACGTPLLVLLAKSVSAQHRAGAATLSWLMLLVGFVMTTAIVGLCLDPYSHLRLLAVTASCAAVCVLLTGLAVGWGQRSGALTDSHKLTMGHAPSAAPSDFRAALREVWQERTARHFTLFIFISMLAYSGQELLLEPFAGRVLELTPGQSARIASLQHGGALLGMLLVALAGSIRSRRSNSLCSWMRWGCFGSAASLAALALCAWWPDQWPLRTHMLILGMTNGIFAVSAIGAMMSLVSASGPQRQGLRMGLWGAAQAVAFAMGGAMSSVIVDVGRYLSDSAVTAYAVVFALQAALFLIASGIAAGVRSASVEFSPRRRAAQPENADAHDLFDVAVIGGGPAGATAAADLAREGYRVLLLDRGGRIKPCGGAIPPQLIADFEIPMSLVVARVTRARMVAPSARHVDMSITGGYVGMVNREDFDEWLRERARRQGCVRATGDFEDLTYEQGRATVRYRQPDKTCREIGARLVVGADGARSAVVRRCFPQARTPFVAAYHEVLRRPESHGTDYSDTRCDVFYQGKLSPDFYAWIFPHGETLSIGVGSARRGFSLRQAVTALREQTGLHRTSTVRCEGAPIPLRPLPRWDDGRAVVLAGDAAGVVAPASGEGIYYAMTGGRCAAKAASAFLQTGDPATLRSARRRFMRVHGRVFFVLGILQRFWYSSDQRRERFVSICQDPDVQRLTWEAYLHKRLVRAKPLAHARIFFKDLMHLMGVART